MKEIKYFDQKLIKNTETSKLKLMVVTVGIITGIIGILSGSSQLLSGSLLIEGNNINALPLNFPNLELYTKMNGYGVFTLVYKIDTDRIFITSFWDNRQNPKNLDEILKNK